MSGQYDAHEARVERARREAERNGRELLSSRGILKAWGKSRQTVGMAVHDGRLPIEYRFGLGPRPLNMFQISDVVAVWRAGDADALERMRANCITLGIGSTVWNVLDPSGTHNEVFAEETE